MNGFISELVGNSNETLEKNKRIKQACSNFGFFCKTYLSDYFFEDAAEYQKILYDVANSQSLTKENSELLKTFVNEKYQILLKPEKKISGAMFVEPREHGKTVRWSFAYVLWRILTGRTRYALLIGAAGDAAKENLSNIKTEIEENEKLISDFGDLIGDVWRDSRIELKNGTCIQAKGAGSSMRGTRFRQYRPDLIILDDIMKDDAIESYTMRNKIHRWMKRVVLNLGKSAFTIWVNTIFHNDDPISRLCRELADGTLKRWICVRLSCLRPDGSPLWPEYWSAEELAEKKQVIGISAFSTEYMNEPLSDEERIIHMEWIDAHRYDVLPQEKDLRFFCGVDPATGKHDRTAIFPIAVHKKTGIIYVLPPFAKTCSETETVNQITLLHKMYNFTVIGWEDVVFSGIYANYIAKLAAEKHIYLPIKKLTVGGLSKEARVRAYTILIETGIVQFPYKGADNAIQELTEFPMGAYDDLCDGLGLAIRVIESGVKNFATSSSGGKPSIAKSIISQVRRLR